MSNEEENFSNDRASQGLRQSVRMRQRAVAEREAARLARPDRPSSYVILPHASKNLSAVSSTPSGITFFRKNLGQNSKSASNEWCGPFSVARQVCSSSHKFHDCISLFLSQEILFSFPP